MEVSPAIDWQLVTQRARGLLVTLSRPEDRDDLDDLVQDACLRFLCATRRRIRHNPDGLLTVVVRRTWIDYLRRKTRERRALRAVAIESRTSAIVDRPELEHAGDSGSDDRLRRTVEAALQANGATDFVPLVRMYLGGRGWLVVSADLGLGHAAVRKRWSRMLALLRRLVAKDSALAERMLEKSTPFVSHPRVIGRHGIHGERYSRSRPARRDPARSETEACPCVTSARSWR